MAKAGAPVAAVGDHGGGADGVLRSGQLPRPAVVVTAQQRPADRDDEPGVSVDDDLVVRRVPIVLGLLGDSMVTRGHQSAVHDQHSVLTEPLTGPHRERRTQVVDDAVGRGLRDAEQ